MSNSTVCIIPASDVPDELERFRQGHIHHSAKAIPLHTTLVGRFLTLEELTDERIDQLSGVAACTAPFPFWASSICAFPTSNALWLSPSPQAAFEEVAHKLFREFPAFRPVHGTPTLHMTIAYNGEDTMSPALTEEFQSLFQDELPLSLRAESIELYCEREGRWERTHCFHFSGESSDTA